jgi:hypothetical protein
VANPIKITKKEELVLKELVATPEGLRVETIQKITDLPKRTIYRKLESLNKKGLIINIYPIWKIVNGQSNLCQSLLSNNNIFELHNLSYVVKLLKTPDWWNKRKNYLIRLKEFQFKEVEFGKDGRNPYQQLINNKFVIQAYPESLIIISKKRYYSNNPYETITEAIKDVMDLLDWFCERFKFNFFLDGVPHIEIRNNDFNRIADYLAKHSKKEGNNFLVEIDKRRKVWVDKSEPFGKEANYPEAQETLEKVTKDLLTKKSFLPSGLTSNLLLMNENLNKVVAIQDMHSMNIVKHQTVLDEMLITLKKIQEKL